jgi:hypothetical protein
MTTTPPLHCCLGEWVRLRGAFDNSVAEANGFIVLNHSSENQAKEEPAGKSACLGCAAVI